jgi:hypothetical protein
VGENQWPDETPWPDDEDGPDDYVTGVPWPATPVPPPAEPGPGPSWANLVCSGSGLDGFDDLRDMVG